MLKRTWALAKMWAPVWGPFDTKRPRAWGDPYPNSHDSLDLGGSSLIAQIACPLYLFSSLAQIARYTYISLYQSFRLYQVGIIGKTHMGTRF